MTCAMGTSTDLMRVLPLGCNPKKWCYSRRIKKICGAMNLLQVDHISTIRGRLHVIISSISPPRMMMVLCPAALTMLAC